MALRNFFEDFVMLKAQKTNDGYGGEFETLIELFHFKAGISTASSDEEQVAYKTGMKTVYNIAIPKPIKLHQNDKIKRVSDGKIFRITSDSEDMETPKISRLNFSQVTAEVVKS